MTHQDIEVHLPFVTRLARRLCKHLPPQVSLDEMVAAGSLGLVEAAARFDGRGAVSFQAYAGLRVRGAMLDTLRAQCCSTRRERRLARESERLRRARAGREGERAESLEGVGAEVQLSRAVPLDEVGEAEALEAALPGSPEELTSLGERKDLAKAMQRLGERHRRILTLLFFREMTLAQVGALLGVSASRVCQLRGEALSELRSMLVE